MPQPVKKSGAFQKPRSKTVKKRTTTKKKEDVKEGINRLPSKTNVKKRYNWRNRPHPEYGTSKLEERFAHEFLDKLGIEYVYQYKAESIGRYFDFRIAGRGPIIEVNGSYWHGDKRLYEEKDLNAVQKRSIKVDEIKRKWCEKNGIKIYYIWEEDINKNPEGVMNFLRDTFKEYINRKRW